MFVLNNISIEETGNTIKIKGPEIGHSLNISHRFRRRSLNLLYHSERKYLI